MEEVEGSGVLVKNTSLGVDSCKAEGVVTEEEHPRRMVLEAVNIRVAEVWGEGCCHLGLLGRRRGESPGEIKKKIA